LLGERAGVDDTRGDRIALRRSVASRRSEEGSRRIFCRSRPCLRNPFARGKGKSQSSTRRDRAAATRVTPSPLSRLFKNDDALHDRRSSSLLDERTLDDVVTGLAADSLFEASRAESIGQITQHAGTAAEHHAVVLPVKRRKGEVFKELAAVDEVSEPPLM